MSRTVPVPLLELSREGDDNEKTDTSTSATRYKFHVNQGL